MTQKEEIKNKEHSHEASPSKVGLVQRLRPLVEAISFVNMTLGVILLIIVTAFGCEYDVMYGTQDSRLISLMSFCGLVVLSGSGIVLLASLKLENKKVMLYYILMSSLLGIYIFVLSVLKIHFALMVVERDTFKAILPENRHFLLSNACVVGITTMFASVIHFISNVTVVTFYNLKYIHPIIFNCGP